MIHVFKGGNHTMKGYNTPYGYMGFVEGRYILFSCEGDFLEYARSLDNN